MPTEPQWLQEMRTALRMVAATEKSRRLHGPNPTASIDGTLEAVCARLAETEVAADPLLRRMAEALRVAMGYMDVSHAARVQRRSYAEIEADAVPMRALLAEFDALNLKDPTNDR